MAEFKKTKLELDHKFSPKQSRHFINGVQTVFHCHHYTVLYTQLAMDASETDLLQSSAEESFYKLLTSYFKNKCIEDLEERIDIACQYYCAMGMGLINIKYMGEDSGKVISSNSHIEEGWIKKWGKFDKPVNYIGRGYVAAMFCAILDMPTKSYFVDENKSIVMGDDTTVFRVVRK